MPKQVPSGLTTTGVSVRVPATSANLGAGFDALGLALQLFDDVLVEIRGDKDHVIVSGEGAGELPTDASHLIVATIRREFAIRGITAPGIRVRSRNRIPQSRGLGSSAAAIVAAHAAVAAMTQPRNRKIDRAAIFAAAAADEGHPDNVAPCVFGGFTVAWLGSDAVADCISMPVHESIAFLCAIPTEHSSTARSRTLLPQQVAMSDAVFNIARASAMVAAMTMDPELLLPAMDDHLHEKQRRKQWPASYALVSDLRAVGIPAAISGAGSTVLVAYPRARAAQIRKTVSSLAPAQMRLVPLRPDVEGVRITRSGT